MNRRSLISLMVCLGLLLGLSVWVTPPITENFPLTGAGLLD